VQANPADIQRTLPYSPSYFLRPILNALRVRAGGDRSDELGHRHLDRYGRRHDELRAIFNSDGG